ncbi:MAG: hypothetical protein SF053_14530 [Bacteroidia bacterium]|nr:hypothetical protein [Bacteroidia bacterium]
MKQLLLLLSLVSLATRTLAQEVDTTRTDSIMPPNGHFSGVITATQNGISLLPNFTLGKPALLFDLSLGRGRWSFDPLLRFAMTGKPWTFVFWGRYKLVNRKRFTMGVGAHPAFVFSTTPATVNGVTRDYQIAQRYFAWETTPTYFFSEQTGIGIHYLGSHGLDSYAVPYTHFVALRGVISRVPLFHRVNMTLLPQAYYLYTGGRQGVYVSTYAELSWKQIPFSLSSVISRKIRSDVAGKDLVWNLQVSYHFKQNYTAKL